MKKSQLPLIIGGFVILILVLTNPGLEDHKAKVKASFRKEIKSAIASKTDQESAAAIFGQTLGTAFAETVIDHLITRDNYLLLSLTKLKFDGEPKVIGVGILGNVFITKKIDELHEESKQ
ncbi:DUF4359 domain-containing protein [Spirosoma endbachense]|uniref:DUF4359 domain-containing protein n=1 Tax=Spirosoma endbachense TaxID=2666025 RepID=A0A6P1VY66_9BACT|nr:DUF4359 domain-containing protein [Spirosoma endbachense]QHV96336.1 DUF4359 domain-containing protein [Spirosoma endbachense]